MNREPVTPKTWGDFRKTGLLLFINSILHVFGWAIVVNVDDGKVTECFPARVTFRGFDNDNVSDSHVKIAEYLKENIDELVEDTLQ